MIVINIMFDCPICCAQKEPEAGQKLPQCTHWICWECYVGLMRSSRSVLVTCPLCRQTESPTLLQIDIDEELGSEDVDEGHETQVQQNNFRLNKVTFSNCRVFFGPHFARDADIPTSNS